MKRFLSSCALVAFAVVVAISSLPVDAALMTYDVTSPTSSSPGGWTVTGSITTPTTGTFSSSSQWTYNIAVSSGSTTYQFSDLDDGDFVTGSIIATGSSLYLDANSSLDIAQNATNYLYWGTRGFSGTSWYFESYANDPSIFVTFSPTPQSGSVIGTVAAVPEPSTWVMGLTGIAFGGFSMFRRRKQD